MSMNSFHARNPKGKAAAHEKKQGPAVTPPLEHGSLARADALLVKQGIAPSRSVAQRLIDAGRVAYVGPHGKEVVGKVSQLLPADAELKLLPGD
ncbi:MAG TPA: S4 domain-containing protein [Rhodocyclaceae bacterium]|nr:S4 domain-containing protein [Rhodocyclaceae bacterium]